MALSLLRSVSAAALLCNATIALAEDLRVPAFTAYMLPDADSARVSEQRGVTRWTDPKQTVNWYGKFSQTGSLSASVELQLPVDAVSKLKLTINGKSREASVTGKGKEAAVVAEFGEFNIDEARHYQITKRSRQAVRRFADPAAQRGGCEGCSFQSERASQCGFRSFDVPSPQRE
jgi:Domain of unknown function (DUF5077)